MKKIIKFVVAAAVTVAVALPLLLWVQPAITGQGRQAAEQPVKQRLIYNSLPTQDAAFW